MISKVKFSESALCSNINFPMLHSLSLFATYYIGRFYFSSAKVDLSNLKQNESLMRIESLTGKQIHATFDNLMTWSVIHFIVFLRLWLAYLNLGRFLISELE